MPKPPHACKAYQANGAHVAGMQAAYRLLLDRISPD